MAEISKDIKQPENLQELAEIFETEMQSIKSSLKSGFEKLGEKFVDSAEYKSKMAKFDELCEKYDNWEKDLKSVQTRMARPSMEAKEAEANELALKEQKAIRSWMKTGQQVLSTEELGEVKTLQHGAEAAKELKIASALNASYAGYLVKPPMYWGELVKHLTEYSPVRQYAKVIQSNADVKVRRRLTAPSSYNRTESGSMTEGTGTYGLDTITAHEFYHLFMAYHWMVEDSDFPIEREAQLDAAEGLAAKQGTAFVSGSGLGEPEGVMTAVSNGDISHRAQGEASTLTNLHALRKLPYDINDQYTKDPNCIYMMKRATLGALVALPDSVGRYLLGDVTEPGVRRIEGYKIVTAPDMATVGASAFPVIFGNFKWYWIVDKLQMVVLRDPYTHDTDGYISISFRMRTGGAVIQPNAFYALEIASS